MSHPVNTRLVLRYSAGNEERQLRALPGVGAALGDAAVPHAGGGGAARRGHRLLAGMYFRFV